MADPVTVIIVAEVLFSSIAVAVFLLWLLRRRNAEVRQLQSTLTEQTLTLKQQALSLPDAFLQRELEATRELAKTTRGDEVLETLGRLRAFWLTAEKQGLIAHGAQPSDHQKIAELLKMSRLYAQVRAKSLKPATRLRAMAPVDAAALDEARGLIDQQKVATRDAVEGHTTLPDDLRKTSAEATANSEHFLQTVDSLERELRRTQQLYQEATTELAASVESNEPELDLALQDFMTTPLPATTKPALREPQFFLDEMNQAYQLGVVDLQRLRETNVRQRELILELEQRLSSTLPGQKPNEDTQKLIEKLRLQLRDYDTCTVILEGESESLRERISTLTLILSEEDDPPIASDFMFPEMAQHYFQARRDLDKTSFEMMREVAGADDLSQAATALTAFFQRQKLHCVLFVRGHDQQLWMASDGLVDPRIKVLLQSMEGNDKPSRTNSGNSLILLLPLCRLHITGTALGSADGEMVKGFMSRMMVIVDLIFGQIDRISGSKSPVDAEETIHFRQLLTSIEARYRYLDSETRRIATDHRQEMESTLMSLPLSPGQKIVVEGLLGDFTAEIDLVTRAATSIHENLQLAVRTLGGHA